LSLEVRWGSNAAIGEGLLTVLAFNLGDASNVTSTESESGLHKQEEGDEPEQEREWFNGSHDCGFASVVE
jgi:hypothetical protein